MYVLTFLSSSIHLLFITFFIFALYSLHLFTWFNSPDLTTIFNGFMGNVHTHLTSFLFSLSITTMCWKPWIINIFTPMCFSWLRRMKSTRKNWKPWKNLRVILRKRYSTTTMNCGGCKQKIELYRKISMVRYIYLNERFVSPNPDYFCVWYFYNSSNAKYVNLI